MFTWSLLSARGSLRCPIRRLIQRKNSISQMCCAAAALVTSPPVRMSVSLSLSSCALCRLIYILQGSFITEPWPAQPPPTLPSLTGRDVMSSLPLSFSHGTAQHKAFKLFNTDQIHCTRALLPLNCLIYFPFVSRPLLCVIFHLRSMLNARHHLFVPGKQC